MNVKKSVAKKFVPVAEKTGEAMILPHKGVYDDIISQAEAVVCLSDNYHSDCMKERNLHLVENRSMCVAFLTYQHSGTGQTVRTKKEHNLKIINLVAEVD